MIVSRTTCQRSVIYGRARVCDPQIIPMASRTRTRRSGRQRSRTFTRHQGPSQQPHPDVASPFEIVPLPCLRCGKLTVPIAHLFLLVGDRASTFSCRACEAHHYLSVTRERDTFAVRYQRYTLRYPLEYYDDGEVPPIAILHAGRHAAGESDGETFAGPTVVYPRKRRFARSEAEAIWRATKGRCHICSQRWQIAQRGPRGWHIDHVIPHIGGGCEVEEVPNFRVACARCNLKKGKGYTGASIRLGLRHLVELLARGPRLRSVCAAGDWEGPANGM